MYMLDKTQRKTISGSFFGVKRFEPSIYASQRHPGAVRSNIVIRTNARDSLALLTATPLKSTYCK